MANRRPKCRSQEPDHGRARLSRQGAPEIWAKTKEGTKLAGSFSLKLLGDLATGFVKTKIEHHTGVKL
jgi:hypothetical protein